MLQTTTEQTNNQPSTSQTQAQASSSLAEQNALINATALLGQPTLEDLLSVIQEESKQRKVRSRLAVIFACLIIAGGVVSLIARIKWGIKLQFVPLMGAFTALTVALSAMSQKQKDTTKALAQFDDVRAVGAFAEALEVPEKDVVAVAERKLRELLPRLQASDAPLLDAQQRAILNKKLLTGNADLVLAILKAYEQVGDSTAVANVETLSRGTKKWDEASDVVQAARACLPFLQERLRRAEQEQTLLRASDGNQTAPETLLRPAAPTQDAQAETLLRATNG